MKETADQLPSISSNNNNEQFTNEMSSVSFPSDFNSKGNVCSAKNCLESKQISMQSEKFPQNLDSGKTLSLNSKPNYLFPTVHSFKFENDEDSDTRAVHNQIPIIDDKNSSVTKSDSSIDSVLWHELSRSDKQTQSKASSNGDSSREHRSSFKNQDTAFHTSPTINSVLGERDVQLDLTSLPSMQPNRSIYKLAYDESLTDQSETDETNFQSCILDSKFDKASPENQVPSSISSAEILIHEADSASDAGSEDVELIPHRYESESFLTDTKHMYINKLSLAVELLRTRENLPYDDEFKRVEEGQLKLSKTYPTINRSTKSGFVNMTFDNDGQTLIEPEYAPPASQCSTAMRTDIDETSDEEQKFKDVTINPADSDGHSFEESCDSAMEVVEGQDTGKQRELRTEGDEVRASYFRFGVQAQHRFNIFTPRSSVVNPCFCCIVM